MKATVTIIRQFLLLTAILGSFIKANAQSDLTIWQTSDKLLVPLNQFFEIKVYVLNQGNSDVTNIKIKNYFPDSTVKQIITEVDGGSITLDKFTSVWNIPSISSNDTLILKITAIATKQGAYNNVSEIMSITGTDTDSTPGNGKLGEDDISFSCYSVPITLTSTNTPLILDLPAPFTSANTISWFGNSQLIEESTDEIVLNSDKTLTISKSGTYSFTSSGVDCPTNGCVVYYILGEPTADLSLTKTANVDSATVGESVLYTITLKNNGPSTATNIEITDILSASLEFEAVSTEATFDITNNGNSVIATLDSIEVNDSKSFKVKAKSKVDTLITNSAEITKVDQPDPNSKPNNNIQTENDYAVAYVNRPFICDISVPVISASNSEICKGDTVILTATPCTDGNIIWSNNVLKDTLKVAPTSPTKYFASCKNSTCRGDSSNVIQINVYEKNPISISSNAKTFCPGDTAVLTATGCPGDVIWNTGDTSSVIKKRINSNFTYIATCGPTSCITSDTFNVAVKQYITPKITASSSIFCKGDSVKLKATGCGNLGFTWNDGSKADSLIVGPSIKTTYSVKCDSQVCEVYTKKTIDVNLNKVEIKTYKEPIICEGDSIILKAENCSTIPNWTTGDSRNEINVSPRQTTNYTVICDQNTACETFASIKVIVNPRSNAQIISPSDTVVEGNSITLQAQGCTQNIKWSTGENTESITITPTENTQINLACGAAQCLSWASKDITVVPYVPPVECMNLVFSADTLNLEKGVYQIDYTALLNNCGSSDISNVKICTDLKSTFPSPFEASITGVPVKNDSSKLNLNTNFNGLDSQCLINSENSTIKAFTVDTIKYSVKLVMNSNNATIPLNIFAEGLVNGNQISDLSNDSKDANVYGQSPTIVKIDNTTGNPIIGLAKELVSLVKDGTIEGEGTTYEATFKFNIENFGGASFNQIQLWDELSFPDGVTVDSVAVFSADAGLVINDSFNGVFPNNNLLNQAESFIDVNETKTVQLFVRFKNSNSNLDTLFNQATVEAIALDSTLQDNSQEGVSADFNKDGDPTNDSELTKIILSNAKDKQPVIGLAKTVSAPQFNTNGSYFVTYTFIIKNYTDKSITNIKLSDDLSSVFSNNTQFSVESINANQGLTANNSFDGKTDLEILDPEGSTLGANATSEVALKLIITNYNDTTVTYNNSANVIAIYENSTYQDISQNGKEPDLDGDGNPNNDSETTPVSIYSSTAIRPEELIPGGFSPNGDGINDTWLIPGVSEGDELQVYIYNRRGQLVFHTDNFKRDFPDANKGWDGKGVKGDELEEGTYYYILLSPTLFNGKPKRDFITLKR